jgi:hypothetical protein
MSATDWGNPCTEENPDGCTAHNLRCGWPDCAKGKRDAARKATAMTPTPERIAEIRPMIDTSKENVARVVAHFRKHDWAVVSQAKGTEKASDLIEALAAERDVANARAEAAEKRVREGIRVARLAQEFIVNGTEHGYIRMPDDANDKANGTLPAIENFLKEPTP